MKNQDSILYKTFCEELNNGNVNCWARHVKRLVDDLGYSYLLDNFDTECNIFPILKQRLRDQYVQNWKTNIREVSKLEYYARFKTEFCYEEYLDFIVNDDYRKALTKFRLCSHDLEIEVGRHSGVERVNRICKLCSSNTTESEYHFLLCCSKYAQLRQVYIRNSSWPNLQKFINVLSSSNKKTVFNLAKYVYYAFKMRKEALNDVTAS